MKMNFLLSIVIAIFVRANLAGEINLANRFEQIIEDLEKAGSDATLHSDTGLNIEQFLHKYNYPLESHAITTEDNYLLTVHRIQHGNSGEWNPDSTSTTKPVVLLVHGMACSSMDWIFTGPGSSLALILADLGYDVWLANLRGNNYTSHKTLTRKDSGFWEYSFHEKGYYDLPATIDYILETTGVKKITYVGHSEGTTTGLVMSSTKPQYNVKINLMALLSPMAFMGNNTSPLIKVYTQFSDIVKLALNIFNIHGFPYSPLMTLLANVFCNDDSSTQIACIVGMGMYSGFDTFQLNKSLITVMFSNTPNGLSIKELDHFSQESKSGYFRQYDYGSIANLLHYGSATPPSYDIKKINVPLAIYYAQNDFLSSISDVEKFVLQLPEDTVDRYLIEYEYFNNLDYLAAIDVRTLLYNRLISVIQKQNPLSIG